MKAAIIDFVGQLGYEEQAETFIITLLSCDGNYTF